MRNRLLVPLSFAVLLATAPPATAKSHHCGDLYQQTDVGPHNIFTRNLTCRTARSILRVWERHPLAVDAGPRNWSCKVKQTSRFSERHYCHRPHGTLSFTFLYA